MVEKMRSDQKGSRPGSSISCVTAPISGGGFACDRAHNGRSSRPPLRGQ
jgi:hypothetical protein